MSGHLLETTTADFVKSCEICNVAFTGPESSAQHFEGKKHRKSLERKQILQKLNQYSRSSVTGADKCDISLFSASSTPGSSSMSSTAGSTSVSSAIPLTSTGLASMSSTTTMTSMLPMVAPCSVPSVSSTATLSSNGQRFDLAHLSASLQDANPSTYPQTTVTSDSVVSLSTSTPLANCIAQTVEPTSVHINPVNLSPRMCSSDMAISPFKESVVGCKSEALVATQSDIVSSATSNICNPLSYDMEAPNITFMDDGSGVQKVRVREAEGYGCKACGIVLFADVMSALEHHETEAHRSKRAILQSSLQNGDITIDDQQPLLH
uniref:Putative secreted protein n=1 Tax=Ixodes ricinus TaxID=34613 RepID=A0A0K8RM06_IXORI